MTLVCFLHPQPHPSTPTHTHNLTHTHIYTTSTFLYEQENVKARSDCLPGGEEGIKIDRERESERERENVSVCASGLWVLTLVPPTAICGAVREGYDRVTTGLRQGSTLSGRGEGVRRS